MIKLLLVEDDQSIAKILLYYLEQTGEYQVVYTKNGGEAISAARNQFDVILMDIMLPDINGVELCRSLRTWQNCPILFITCIEDDDILVEALEAGGDDYLVKPFDNKVLHARIKATLRRAGAAQQPDKPQDIWDYPGFRVDARRQALVKNGKTYRLGNMEYRVLLHFLLCPRQYFSASELYSLIWEKPSYGDVRTVQVHIHNLRRKLEDDPSSPRYLCSEWGKGYYFNPNPQEGT